MVTLTPATSVFRRAEFGAAGVRARMTAAGLSLLADIAMAGRGCCFTFHRAATSLDWASQPNRGFHLDIAYLECLLTHLKRTGWDIVSMTEALERAAQRGCRRFVNFSVDDGYRDTVDLVVPLFRRLQAPLTLFVTTGIPDGTLCLRDAGLATILRQEDTVSAGGVTFDVGDDARKRAAFSAISRAWDVSPVGDDDYRRFARSHGYELAALDEQHRLTWPALKAAADDPLVEVGGHTVDHRRLSTLPTEAAMAEIAGCRARLQSMLGRPVRHFAFPFGRAGDCGPRESALVQEAGFASAATTRKGLIGRHVDRFRLPRNTLHGAHRGLPLAYAHLLGISGVAARWVGRD